MFLHTNYLLSFNYYKQNDARASFFQPIDSIAQSKFIFFNYQEKEEEEVMMNGENTKKKIHPNRKIDLLSLAFFFIIIINNYNYHRFSNDNYSLPKKKGEIIIIKQIIFLPCIYEINI